MSGTAVNSRPNELQSIVTQLLQAERKVAPSFKFEKFIQLHAFFRPYFKKYLFRSVKTDMVCSNISLFAQSVRDRLLNLISWAKSVPGESQC